VGKPRPRALGHAVVLPYLPLADDFALPDCPRWAVVAQGDMTQLVGELRRVGEKQETHNRHVTVDDVYAIADILRGRSLPQRDLLGASAEREDVADRLTQQQAAVLDAIRLLPRVEVRGGAGSGKTWLAVEQARRLSHAALRVALLCYSRGLAAFLQRRAKTFPSRRDVPAYVGTFHGLGAEWGAEPGSDDDSDYWERRLPEQMVTLAREQRAGLKFDAIVIDEAQDFADLWWPALLSALKNEETGPLYAFSDEGQRVFSRYGGAPAQLVPIVLDHILRNTKQIGESFNTLAAMRMRLLGGDGPDVRLVECAPGDALDRADDEVDALLDEGWRPEDVALLATGSRHPEQTARQAAGPDAYWESFWDVDQVFYGHVLGFKGLERRAVVLAVNEPGPSERSQERLYVGLSRARDQLVVCGAPDFITQVGASTCCVSSRGPGVTGRSEPRAVIRTTRHRRTGCSRTSRMPLCRSTSPPPISGALERLGCELVGLGARLEAGDGRLGAAGCAPGPRQRSPPTALASRCRDSSASSVRSRASDRRSRSRFASAYIASKIACLDGKDEYSDCARMPTRAARRAPIRRCCSSTTTRTPARHGRADRRMSGACRRRLTPHDARCMAYTVWYQCSDRTGSTLNG